MGMCVAFAISQRKQNTVRSPAQPFSGIDFGTGHAFGRQPQELVFPANRPAPWLVWLSELRLKRRFEAASVDLSAALSFGRFFG